MYLNVFIYKMFHASTADISLMVGASLVAAALTKLLIGALSDRLGERIIWHNLIYSFKPSVIKNNGLLYAILVAFALFGISIQILCPI